MITDFERRLVSEEIQDPKEQERILEQVDKGEPLAYLLGKWFFWRYTFWINRDCLIPRPDTECLVEEALTLLPPKGKFVDLCTGCGCIALSLLRERPDSQAIGVDISSGALQAAQINGKNLAVSHRWTLLQADLLREDPLSDQTFSLLLSNPPYIPTKDLTDYPELKAEPEIALNGGFDGLSFYRRFLTHFSCHLQPKGSFLFEIGYDQGDAISELASSYGFSCRIRKDYGGRDRVAILTKKIESTDWETIDGRKELV
jgi:release factor glutamine methyltransferase